MAQTVIRMGGYQGEASVHTRAGRRLAAVLDEATNGAARLELVPDVTALGRPATDLFAMVEGDELDLCYFAASYLAHRVPDLAGFDLPFQVRDRTAVNAALDGALGAALAARVAARTGFALVAAWDNGFRHFTNAHRPLVAPADCRSLRIRTMDSALHQVGFAALGFEPVYIDVKDYPAAVRSGAVDAQENPLTNTVNFGVQAVHPHLTLSGHFFGLTLVLANRAWLEALPLAIRAGLEAALIDATAAQRSFAVEADRSCRAVIEAAGVSIVEADGFDRAAFEAATAGVVSAAAASLDPEILRLLRA
ncbi:TRAP transporter substrate-binding protein [Antarcticirhabdus aurantiaca]|uniref:TRAP transporter substrate-binding protein n=1 Tax=Antarcticirhabdus aurantiaca TaxID=2606717 RepID=A0ACD4NMG3_9HYPH|nr:TRAP transporter substrate-binding protein [Antarcticirhabdus aurantiaca]WAJ28053.1 TRAP transporter substrate-binding protein [Jeongeuplla avenae]